MATETATKRPATKTKSAAAAPTDDAATVKAADPAPSTAQSTQMRAKEADMEQYITVKNGFQGMLVYVSKRTGEVFVWDNFGDEQDMELRELKNAKNSSKGFFINNWFMFDDDNSWVIDYLGLRQYYKHSVSLNEIDELFHKDPDELAEILKGIPKGQRKTIAYRARQLIESGEIDSRKVVSTLENGLGIQLIER